MKKITITAEQQYTMQRAASREAEIAQGRINYKRVHESKKAYKRKQNVNWGE